MIEHLLTIVAMGAVTYLTRLLPIRLFTRIDIPLWAQQALRYVPTAVLTAILVPEVLMPAGALDVTWANTRLLAGLAAVLAAALTRNVLWTVAVGMGVLWGVGALGG